MIAEQLMAVKPYVFAIEVRSTGEKTGQKGAWT